MTTAPSAARYDGPIFDADTHVHEIDYTFFREYLPREFQDDCLLQVRDGPEGFGMYVGPRRVHNNESNPDGLVPPPGKLKDWLKAMKEGKSNVEGWIQPTADMWDRDARLRKLDEFGVEGSIIFPGGFISSIGYYRADRTGNAVLTAYNRYLHEHWGFDVQDRIYATPLLSLWDLESSIAETERVIKQGARIVCMPMGPAGGKSPAHPDFDPVWSRLNEAGVAVAYHVSEANFMHSVIEAFGEKPLQARRTGQTAWQWMFCYSEIRCRWCWPTSSITISSSVSRTSVSSARRTARTGYLASSRRWTRCGAWPGTAIGPAANSRSGRAVFSGAIVTWSPIRRTMSRTSSSASAARNACSWDPIIPTRKAFRRQTTSTRRH